MVLTKQQLADAKDHALRAYQDGGKLEKQNPAAFMAACWINGLNNMLGKEGMELYAFPKNYNETIADPQKFLDVSGKITLP